MLVLANNTYFALLRGHNVVFHIKWLLINRRCLEDKNKRVKFKLVKLTVFKDNKSVLIKMFDKTVSAFTRSWFCTASLCHIWQRPGIPVHSWRGANSGDCLLSSCLPSHRSQNGKASQTTPAQLTVQARPLVQVWEVYQPDIWAVFTYWKTNEVSHSSNFGTV